MRMLRISQLIEIELSRQVTRASFRQNEVVHLEKTCSKTVH